MKLDQRLGLGPVMVEIARLKSIRLSDYTHLLMVNGRYSGIDKSLKGLAVPDPGGLEAALEAANA